MYNEGTPLAEAFPSSGILRRGLSVTLSIFLIVGTVEKTIENYIWARVDMEFLFECLTR